MKRSQNIRTIRIAVLAALALPLAALAQEPPEQPPVDPATPVDTAAPVDPVPPDDPMQATTPWTPPAEDPAAQSPPATPPTQSDTSSHVLQDERGRDVRLTEHPPSSVVGDYGVDFDAMDTDGDGHISRAEARANQTLHAEFDGVDRDHDGRLSRDELADWTR
ncbi:MAG: EF-hand domain-containing protein [Luteimonas sp.]